MTLTHLPITAIVSTKNEEAAIEVCLDSLVDFAEIVVVDSMSTDRTKELAADRGCRIVEFQWNGQYPKKKQWCLDNVDTLHEWILFIDADERPSRELINEMASVAHAQDGVAAFDVPLAYRFMGRTLRHGHVVNKRILLRRGKVSFPVIDDLEAPGMGELEGHYQPTAHGTVVRLRSKLIHDDPDPLRTWVDRHNKYSDWEAYLKLHGEAGRSVRSVRSRQGRWFQRLPLKPVAFFIYCFVARQGFRDGVAGFRYALSLSWYYWLIDVKYDELRAANRR